MSVGHKNQIKPADRKEYAEKMMWHYESNKNAIDKASKAKMERAIKKMEGKK